MMYHLVREFEEGRSYGVEKKRWVSQLDFLEYTLDRTKKCDLVIMIRKGGVIEVYGAGSSPGVSYAVQDPFQIPWLDKNTADINFCSIMRIIMKDKKTEFELMRKERDDLNEELEEQIYRGL